jgi:hypothetical protein
MSSASASAAAAKNKIPPSSASSRPLPPASSSSVVKRGDDAKPKEPAIKKGFLTSKQNQKPNAVSTGNKTKTLISEVTSSSDKHQGPVQGSDSVSVSVSDNSGNLLKEKELHESPKSQTLSSNPLYINYKPFFLIFF